MTGPGALIARYLRDRLGLVLAWYAGTLLLTLLGGLLLTYAGAFSWAIAAYAMLLATAVLLSYLTAAFIKWWPFARATAALQATDDLEAFAAIAAPGTAEQQSQREQLARLYQLAVMERTRYQEAHQRQLDFIHLWVHQMKTPISAISLIAQEAGGPALESVDEEAAKLAEGLELVLNMARLQDFALDYLIEPVDLGALVRKVINQKKKQFIRTGIFPEVTGEAVVRSDAKWLAFVVDQITANALKYSAQTPTPHQRLRFTITQNSLTIADQGPGIPAHDLPRVFDAFFTGENGRRFAQATGIGLYLVKQVTDRLGHTITIHSVPGQGTTVILTFQN
ncbi:MAG: two-component sensor histidine kinase [Symbiobacteriaceae bacterium]|jgi:signal transduction histidine kinase|nr:two-component sensor histidine kinase [Symbiobacteriaceae bacterium]